MLYINTKTGFSGCALGLLAGLGLAVLPAAGQTPAAAGAPEVVYRVEIVVFRHAGAPLLPPGIPKNYAQNRVPLLDLEVIATDEASAGSTGSPPIASATMETIAERLARSGNDQVLQQQSWLQRPGVWPNPPVKWLHDDLPIASGDGTAAAADNVLYQLEGTVGFAEQRFFHLVLDFELRAVDETGRPVVVDRLAQSRQIDPGRVEYFDTAGLAVLALVSPLESGTGPDDEAPKAAPGSRP